MPRAARTVLLILFCQAANAEPLPEPGALTPNPRVSTEPSTREAARQWFSAAVSLARAGRYASAKALFLEAYAAEPHYLVLYNIAQAELHLGELASAASFLRRFLAEGGADISPERRQAVENEIQRIEARQALPPVDGSVLLAADARAEPRANADPAAPSVSALTSRPARHEAPTRAPTTSSPLAVREGSMADGEKVRIWGYVLTTGGFAMLAGSVGLYAWNHERHNRWQTERAELLATTEQGVSVESEPILNARVRENNARLASIKSFDAVPIAILGVGVAAMGAGLWTLIETREGDHVEVASSPSEVELRVHWTW